MKHKERLGVNMSEYYELKEMDCKPNKVYATNPLMGRVLRELFRRGYAARTKDGQFFVYTITNKGKHELAQVEANKKDGSHE